jgi:PTS system ascorbate-specific IIA component
MSVGIVIVTHGKTGESLIQEAGFVLGKAMDDIIFVEFNRSEYSSGAVSEIRSAIVKADSGDGVLVLSDLMGASPSNLVADVLEEYHALMVTGLNLGMLIRVCNYREKSLELVARMAVEGGRRAVKIFQK